MKRQFAPTERKYSTKLVSSTMLRQLGLENGWLACMNRWYPRKSESDGARLTIVPTITEPRWLRALWMLLRSTISPCFACMKYRGTAFFTAPTLEKLPSFTSCSTSLGKFGIDHGLPNVPAGEGMLKLASMFRTAILSASKKITRSY